MLHLWWVLEAASQPLREELKVLWQFCTLPLKDAAQNSKFNNQVLYMDNYICEDKPANIDAYMSLMAQPCVQVK